MHNCKFHGLLLAVLLASGAGCAHQPAQHPQCDQRAFRQCLDVDVARCDALFSAAKSGCEQKHSANTMFDNMPDRIKESHLQRCIVDDLVAESGRSADIIKDCLRW